MLRLISTQGLFEVWKCSHRVTSRVTKRNILSLLSVRSIYYHRPPHILARVFSTGSAGWKDALQPQTDKSEELDIIDLDKWKSVMRSQAASGEKVDEKGEASDDDGKNEPGGDSKFSSSLEATREMVTMWREAGKLVPEEISDEQVRILAELTTKSARKKYLKFLAIKEGHKKASKEKQLKRKTEKEALSEQRKGQDSEAMDGDERPQELKRTFIRKFWDRSLDQHLAWRSAQAMMFGQPLVFDMSYDTNMSRREVENTVSQLMEVEGWNRRATEPFHLHFCNLQKDGAYMQELLKRYGAVTWDHLLITTSNRQHVDMFPHEQLVYLTADSPNVLHKFDHSKIYIIGALVDRSIQSGLSLANAKRLKLATARLPLDEYLHWEMGAKNLTLDQMIRIMLTVKETGKWDQALKFVPQRKHDGFHQQKTQKVITNNRGKGVPQYEQGLDNNWPLRPKSDSPTFQPTYKGHNEAVTKVRTSFKSTMERGKGAGKNKMWWDKD